MNWYCRLCSIAFCFAYLFLAGCSGSDQQPETLSTANPITAGGQPVGLDWQWPPPSSLALPARQAAVYDPADLIKQGRDFAIEMANNLVAAADDSARFTPNFSAETGLSLENAAYCHYFFHADGYDREAEVHWAWSQRDASLDDIWIGVGNFSADRWEWFPANSDGMLNLGTMDTYLRDGDDAVMAVVVLGTAPCDLRYIRIGTPQVEAKLAGSPWGGIAPLNIEFDGSASTTEVGTITDYSWDMDNNGSFEEDTGTVATISEGYTESGNHTVGLRVTNNFGVSHSKTYDFVVSLPWAHTMGGESEDAFTGLAVSAPDAIYCAGSTASFETGSYDVLLCKYDYLGNLSWAKTWGGPSMEQVYAVARDNDGNLLMTGYTRSFGEGEEDLLLLKWTPDGDIVWAKTWGGVYEDEGKAISIVGTDCYVAGYTSSFDDPSGDILVLKYDLAGDPVWVRCWGGEEIDKAMGLKAYAPFMTLNVEIHVTGVSRSYTTPAKDALFYSKLKPDGSASTHRIWNPAVDGAYGYAVSAYGALSADVFVVGYIYEQTPEAHLDFPLLLGASSTTQSVAQQWEDGIAAAYAYDIHRRNDSLYICGESQHGAFILRTSATGANESGIHLPVVGNYCLNGIYPFAGYGFITTGRGDHAAGINWSNAAGSWSDAPGTWSDEAITPNPLTGSITSPEGTVTDVTTAVLDLGGGGSDGFIAIVAVP